MLGLATHELQFTIIREEFKPNQPKPCPLCSQMGHELKNCEGLPREKKGEVILLNLPSTSGTKCWLENANLQFFFFVSPEV